MSNKQEAVAKLNAKFTQRSTRYSFNRSFHLAPNPQDRSFRKMASATLNEISPAFYAKMARPVTHGAKRRVVIETSLLKRLDRDLKEMKRETFPYCSYINSFQINEELHKIKATRSPESKGEIQAKCISKLVSLHLKRLNIKSSLDVAPVLDINELSRNEATRGMSIKQIQTESLRMRKMLKKEGKVLGKGERTVIIKPRSMFVRKLESPFKFTRRRTGTAEIRSIKQNLSVRDDTKEDWYNCIEKGCNERLGENATMGSMLHTTEKLCLKKYAECEGTMAQVMEEMKAPRIIIYGGGIKKVINCA